MGFKETLSELKKSSEFKEFRKENPDAYLCAAFFVINEKIEQRQIHFWLKEAKIATFIFNEDKTITLKKEEPLKRDIMQKLDEKINFDIEDIQRLIEKEIKKDKQDVQISKIIAILQVLDDKQIWNITSLLSGLSMLRIHINMDGKILEKTKGSVFDIVRK